MHLRENGFEVDERDTGELASVKERLGVPRALATCHTAEIGDYVVEGHVPAEVVRRLLEEKPADVAGIGVAGMPMGSPGMEVPGGRTEPYEVIAWDRTGKTWVYDRR